MTMVLLGAFGLVVAAAMGALTAFGLSGTRRAHADVERALRRWGLPLRAGSARWRTPFVLEGALVEAAPMRSPRIEMAVVPASLAWGARWVSEDRRSGRVDVLMDLAGRPRAELDLVRVRAGEGLVVPAAAVSGARPHAVGGWVCWTASEVGVALAAQIAPLLDELAPGARRLRLRYIVSPEFVLELPLVPRDGAVCDLDGGLKRLCAAAVRVPPGCSCKDAEAAGSAAGSAHTQIQN